jgi:hypothetical protein
MRDSELKELISTFKQLWPRWMMLGDEVNQENAQQLRRMFGRYSLRQALRGVREYYDVAGQGYRPDMPSIMSHIGGTGDGPEKNLKWTASDESALALAIDFYTSRGQAVPDLYELCRDQTGKPLPSDEERSNVQLRMKSREELPTTPTWPGWLRRGWWGTWT